MELTIDIVIFWERRRIYRKDDLSHLIGGPKNKIKLLIKVDNSIELNAFY